MYNNHSGKSIRKIVYELKTSNNENHVSPLMGE